VIPDFEEETGNLPPGIHEASWEEVAERFGATSLRRRLLGGLRQVLDSLMNAGCRRAYIDGSFVTKKEVPGDFDGCWEAAGVDPGKLDPVLLEFRDLRASQKAKFGGEVFPIEEAPPGGTTILDFFQRDRDGRPKGIIAVDLGGQS
jgi:hypothetical protein